MLSYLPHGLMSLTVAKFLKKLPTKSITTHKGTFT